MRRRKLILAVGFLFLFFLTFQNVSVVRASSEGEAFVTRFYRECLGREPDIQGLNNWKEALLSGSLTGSEVAKEFVTSPEYLNRQVTDGEFVEMLYRAILNRGPDVQGRQTWLSALEGGKSRVFVLVEIVSSQEFNDICREYGINPGTIKYIPSKGEESPPAKPPPVEQVPLNLIVSPTNVTVQQAQRWAAARRADQRFIDIAPVYWEYGRLTGINPEILYCQSAKETAFGRYGGAVTPEMNNWAGIKIRNPIGDRREDHETFATPEEGVRAHFNHMSAYVGKQPIGQPHDRYYVVLGLSWAGTILTVEQLGARWAPASNYGESIMNHYLADLMRY